MYEMLYCVTLNTGKEVIGTVDFPMLDHENAAPEHSFVSVQLVEDGGFKGFAKYAVGFVSSVEPVGVGRWVEPTTAGGYEYALKTWKFLHEVAA